MSSPEDTEAAWAHDLEAACQPPTLLSAGYVLERATDRTPFVIDRAIPEAAITLLLSPPGVGKSWLAYAMVRAVCRGEPWLGIEPAPERGACLVLSYDNPPQELGRRIKRLGFTPADPVAFHAPERPDVALKLPDKADLIRGIAGRRVRGLPVRLIVVDSFRQAHTKDENDSGQMGEVMAHFKAITAATGAAVLVLHHATKPNAAGESSARGSGEILASADCEIALHPATPKLKARAQWRKIRGWKLADGDETIEFSVVDPCKGRTEVLGSGGDRAPDPELTPEGDTGAAADAAELAAHLAALPPHVRPTGAELAAALGWRKARVVAARKLLNGAE